MDIGKAAVAVAVTALSVSACGYRLGASVPDPGPVREHVVATQVASVPEPELQHHATTAAAGHDLPPNAAGDPACPPSQAWGRQPEGSGVLVTVWSHDPAAVTVLVRTASGTDVADRAVLGRDDLRLFEFPKIDPTVVREVLIMTSTQRCFAIADPVTFK